MPEGRYDDLMRQREQERADAAERATRERKEKEMFRDQYVTWRNGVKAELATRAKELEGQYPHLQQLFVNDVQDELSIRKSLIPAGSVNIYFDRENFSITCEYRIYGDAREPQSTHELRFALEVGPDDRIVIRDGADILPTGDFVNAVFDGLMPYIM